MKLNNKSFLDLIKLTKKFPTLRYSIINISFKYTKTNIAEDIVTYVKHKIGYSEDNRE